MEQKKEARIIDLIPENLREQLKIEILKEVEEEKKKARSTPATEEELNKIFDKF